LFSNLTLNMLLPNTSSTTPLNFNTSSLAKRYFSLIYYYLALSQGPKSPPHSCTLELQSISLLYAGYNHHINSNHPIGRLTISPNQNNSQLTVQPIALRIILSAFY
jgi:hypothetical protein